MSVRERRLVWVVGALAAVLVIVTLVSLASHSGTSGHGCVRATYAGPVGAEQVSACGEQARELCATLRSAGYTGDAAATLSDACRKAGLKTDL